ncbi:SGNH/GDSL hydrolase family protein [Jeotgalibaca porci]|uniref:SGNH/GDSL hydrolase family protein n=1 Tax=Jeotgalibaca porci TaxID=1868793 RepID=UPI0035A1C31C
MAELIKTTDSLNDGRKKLNDAITDSNAALSTANTAKQTANLAKAESESTQTQLDTIVIEGDSSVEAAQARVNNSGTAFPTLKQRLDAEHQEVTAQLQQKANQAFVDSQLSAIVSGAPKGTYTNLATLESAYPSGAEGIFLVIENGHWYYWQSTTSAWTDGGVYQADGIADGSVTGEKINTSKVELVGSDLSEGNLVDDKYVDQYGVEQTHTTGGIGGVTEFIAVAPGDKIRYFAYTSDVRLIGATYNASKVFIGPISAPATNNAIVDYEVPESIAFIRVNYSDATLAQFFVSKVTEQKYSPAWLTIGEQNIEDGAITLPKLEGVTKVYKNLFDKTKATAGLYINQQGGTAAATGYYASDYMPVEENTTYTQYATYFVSFYDINKAFISSINGKSVVSPAGTVWARTSAQSTNIDVFQFEKGPVSTSYEPYGSKFTLENLNFTTENLSKWFKKTAIILGDSITYGAFLSNINDRYSELLAQDMDMTVKNYGISSTLITRQTGYPNSFVERYADMDDDADLIIVFGGTNDYFFGTGEIGATNSTDDTTFNGALNTLITGLQNKYPDAEIVFVTPYSQAPDTRNSDNPNPVTGLNLKGYRDCLLERCSYHGVPVLDLYATSGINGAHNAVQKAKYLLDGCHPNKVGHRRIADRLVGLLKSL